MSTTSSSANAGRLRNPAARRIARNIRVSGGASAPAKHVREKIPKVAAHSGSESAELELRVWTIASTRPVIATELLMSSQTMTFGKFLELNQTKELFSQGDSGRLLEELLKAREFHYFGSAAGKFRKHKTRSRKMLTKYVRRAYRGSDRGVAYWGRIAKLLWLSYEHLQSLRYWAQRAEQRELARMERKVTRSARERLRLKVRHKQKRKQKGE